MIVGAILLILISRIGTFLSGNIGAYQILPTFFEHITNKTATAFLIYLGVVSSILGLIRQMVNMVGGRVLRNIILGKYHNPKDEERIFMFLDLKSSTTHAEKLGHTRFCRLIQDCFHELTDSAIKRKVEIYQYVGDEAILTWTMKDGIKDSNCIKVYFDFQGELEKKSDYYQQQYGLILVF